MKQKIQNPILPGYHPDPSVCRKGEDYYLVTSTFEYFPGVPIYHSRDLIHWEIIGHCLNRPEQLNLDDLNCSKGIYAPTIRYNEKTDLFYMITTLVKNEPYWGNVNFFVTAKDPRGPWSDPIIVKGAEGIDPTLFFDDNGKTYYLGNMRSNPDDLQSQNRYIWLQELDINTGSLLGERVILRKDGALYHAKCPEGPHLYKIGAWYYLLIAEGGTARNHSVTVFRSKTVTGPYEENPRNPLITHRNLRTDWPINSVGHADLFQTQNGEWFAVLLGTRPIGSTILSSLGRETFLVPVIWEEEWPVFSPDSGRVEFSFPAPKLSAFNFEKLPNRDQFDHPELDLRYEMIRTPRGKVFSLTEKKGWLRLFLKPETLSDRGNPSFIGRRQQHKNFSASAKMMFSPKAEGEYAGMTVFMSDKFHLSFFLAKQNGVSQVVLLKTVKGESETVAQKEYRNEALYLKVEARELSYSICFSEDEQNWEMLAENLDGSFLSVDSAGGFNGAFVGLFATANGKESENSADFDWFEYSEI